MIWTKILYQICKLPIKAGLEHGIIFSHCDKVKIKTLRVRGMTYNEDCHQKESYLVTIDPWMRGN